MSYLILKWRGFLDIKKELGRRIRTIREDKKLTREDICNDESDLTVRQLLRIEKGESLPSLPKISYIAKKIDTPITSLIDESYTMISNDYLKQKNILLKKISYGKKENIEKIEKTLDNLFIQYYEDLPEDEQLFINLMQSRIDFQFYDDIRFGEPIILDYIDQLLKKKNYTENDLILIEVYLHYLSLKDYDKHLIKTLLEKSINQTDVELELLSFLLLRILLAILNIFEINNDFDMFRLCIDTANTLMIEHNDFKKKPIIDMVEGKYYLLYKKDPNTALNFYESGANLAKIFGDNFLAKRILEEYQIDINKINLK